ncbi:hypothetical protein QBC44DRAFT_351832 [Cladorrhinum sp. PSN332]|nr:hypothetical protein QBC44DRAFT_351832 [Cladorrhinum sp. PSN332]
MSYKTPDSEPIAIVGTACRFTGGAISPSRLWDILIDPTDLAQKIPQERFNVDAFYHQDGEYHGTTDSPKAYFLQQDHRVFDASFFNITPREAEAIDPQQRMLLEVVYEALSSAGFTLQQYAGSKVGVFAGLMTGDYDTLSQRDELHTSQYYATGNARSILSNRLSYFFDFRGPSMTIDTACSSSLVALHQAVLSVRSGECDMACVAGANLILTPEQFIVESNLHMLSPNGHSRHFDAAADGYARGEGIAAMFIRPLSKALANGDHIVAVIRETATNSDGRTPGITMPNWEAQSTLIQDTYRRTGLDIKTIQGRCQYFECHGTGTKAGDPKEARAIEDAFFGPNDSTETDNDTEEDVPDDARLVVGSVKSIIGHTEGAAGLAGVLKVIESMDHNMVPPNLHLNELNPEVRKYYGHLRVPTEAIPWPGVPEGQPKRASVNSFGFGGSNAHAIVEQYTPDLHDAAARALDPDLEAAPTLTEFNDDTPEIEQVCLPLLLSAQSPASLLGVAIQYRDYLRTVPSPSAKLVAWSTTRMQAFPHRLAVARNSTRGLFDVLDNIISKAQSSTKLSIGSRTRTGSEIRILGIFTGQGAQWPTMTRGLLLSHEPFAQTIRFLDEILNSCADPPDWTLENEILADKERSRVQVPAISQPLCTAIQIALVNLLTSIGITFHTVVGHSSGEMGAAYAAGRISAEEAILVAYYRGLSARLASSPRGVAGGMVAVALDRENAGKWCERPEYNNAICMAASNSPGGTTLSGDVDMIQLITKNLGYEHKGATVLKVDAAYHSAHMTNPAVEYLAKIQACNISPSKDGNGTNWVSSVSGGGQADNASLRGTYWRDNMVSPVLFYEAVKHALKSSGPFDCIIEVGPHPALKKPVMETLTEAGSVIPYLGVLDRRLDDREAFASFLGSMWAECGAPTLYIRQFVLTSSQPDLVNVNSRISGIPTYPWDHSQQHWRESRISRQYHFKKDKPHELLGVRTRDDNKYQLRWRNILRAEKLQWVQGHSFQGQALLPASAYLVMALDAARAVAANHQISLVELQNLKFPAGITLEPDGPGVESLFSLTIERDDTEGKGEGKIEASMVISSTIADGNTDMKKNFSGTLIIVLGRPSIDVLPRRPQERAETLAANPEAFYTMMAGTGLNYTGAFQGLQELQRRYDFSSGTLRKYHPDDTTGLTISPATLDSCLQTAFVTISSPGDKAIWTSFLPLNIECVRFNTAICDIKSKEDDMLAVDAYMTKATPTTKQIPASFTADIEIFNPLGELEIQIEGLTVGSFNEMKPEDDYELYLTTKLDVDPDDEIVSTSIEEMHRHSPMLIESCQRVASFYASAASVTELCTESHRALGTAFAETGVRVDKRAWNGQTEEAVDQFMRRSPYFASLDLIRRLGREVPDALGGLLPTLVEEAHQLLGFQKHISRAIQQIAHKYPRMSVLGLTDPDLGLSEHILSGLGDTFLSYRIGAEPEANLSDRYELTPELRKKLMVDVVDLDTDELESRPSYDLVVLTSSQLKNKQSDAVFRRVCRMMRPGGFLLLVQISRNPLKERLGIVAGAEPAEPEATPVAFPDWADVLDRSGFMCSLRGSHQYYPPGFSLIVRQADSIAKEMLQRPLQHSLNLQISDHILIVGGKKPYISDIATIMNNALEPECETITSVEVLDELDEITASSVTAVLFLADIDEPALAHMTEKRMDILKSLLRPEMRFLWVTVNSRFIDANHAASFGFTRTMAAEIPGLVIQTLDLDTVDTIPAANAILETFAQLLVRSLIHGTTEETKPLWVQEHEVHYEDGRRLVPRVLPWKEANDRVNAPRRVVSTDVNTAEKMVRIVAAETGNGRYSTEVAKCDPTRPGPSDLPRMQVEYSTVDALNLGHGVSGNLCIGRDTQTFVSKVALSPSNASYITTPSTCVTDLDESPGIDQPLFLGLLARYLIAITVARTVETKPFLLIEPMAAENMTNKPVLLVEPDEMLHRCIIDVLDNHEILYTLCTTSEARSQLSLDLVFLHTGMSRREIKKIVPVGGAWLFNLLPKSDKLSKMLENSLPANCTYTHYSDWLGPINDKAENILAVNTIWNDAVGLSLSKVKKWTSGAEPALLSVSQLLRSQENTVPFQLVNWKADRFISHITQPLACTQALSPRKTYVLIGITRDFGQSLCTLFVDQGARHIVLASRNPPRVAPRWQIEMQSRGINVQFKALDVVDLERVGAFKDDLSRTMPPVGGVVNGAMVLEDKVFSQMSLDSLRRVMGPKTIGSSNLDQHFRDPEMDFFIMTSSFAAIGGHAGQSNYAAANMYMNGLAAARRQGGLVGSVLNIGVIYGLGFLHREKDNLYEGLEREGYPPISERDIHHMFVEAIMAGKPVPGQVYDITTGLRRFQANLPSLPWHNDPRFSHYTKREDDSNLEVDVDGSKKSLKELIEAARDKDELIKVLELAFFEKLQTQLLLAEGAVTGEHSLSDLGVDSLAAVEIRGWVWKSFGFDVPVMRLLGGITISRLCQNIAEAITEAKISQEKLRKAASGEPDSPADSKKSESGAQVIITPSHQRILPGSAQLPPAPWPASATAAADQIDAAGIADKVISSINNALSEEGKKNYPAIASLFRGNADDDDDNCFWRDHLGLSWDLRTLKGKEQILSFLSENGEGLVRVEVDASTAWKAPQVANFAPAGDVKGVGFYIKFESSKGKGRGVVRLVQESGEWKIWTVFTTLEELKGFEEPLRGRRQDGVQHGGMVGRKNWREKREGEVEGVEPEVVIVGAGQGGLTIAARLKMLGISTLIIDKNERVGDNWRKRYHQLVLHDPVWYDHMPYLPFPEFWPVFTPKDKLAEWFESYVKALELNVWMESEVESSDWDEEKKEWTVTVKKGASGEKRTLKPKHVVLCTGHSGKANLPTVKGMDDFKGDVICHSSAFAGAKETGKGKKAVVVGACNSSHDICQDFYEKGYEVTMVQRSSTCVVSSKAALKVLMAVLYEEGGPPVEDSDIWLYGWPSQILKSIQVDLIKIQQDIDKDLLAGLERAGFKTDDGIDKGGLFAKYLQRGGGYYIDVGMSQLIIDGKVKVKHGQEIVEVLPNGLKFSDGTELEADEIVFATGYDSMKGTARSIFGGKVADQTEDIWGWNEEGEMRGVWKGSGHPAFWYHAGNLALARYHSRLLALQIKGKLEALH